jgi:hypothetical protein
MPMIIRFIGLKLQEAGIGLHDDNMVPSVFHQQFVAGWFAGSINALLSGVTST